ncbi:hypothetical protein HJC23_001027 [Cyclotella cryptica]|uniref:t-SNARE coiled-coil homology domain-containing protein n=1 Tax=Cyclotella cryptica TaxID=29204 RepID=A0ABD3P354_9STRA|eukprot:CCRYP_018015-RA/>CCRYP_018015-RA protein AED:0.12 eAED:0.12 QI:0/-1/0/1/-1/1/1/0/486
MTSILPPSPHHPPHAPPPTATPPTEWKSHSVNRTAELLSCARTALKIGQARLRQRREAAGGRSSQRGHGNDTDDDIPEWLAEVPPASLTLYTSRHSHNTNTDFYGARHNHNNIDDEDIMEPSQLLLRDSTALLSLLDSQLSELHSLVRRRGHTNDPTLEIQATLEKFHEGIKEMKEVCASLAREGNVPVPSIDGKKRLSVQRRKHYELLSSHLESLMKERMDRLKKELEMRSVVIRDQMSHRKKLLSAGTTAASAASGGGASTVSVGRVNVPLQKNLSAASTSAQFQSPLFTMTASGNGPNLKNANYKSSASAPTSSNGNGHAVMNQSASSGYYAGYGGYGGASTTTTAPTFSTGMRQRKQPSTSSRPTSHTLIDQGDTNHDDDDNSKYTKDNTLQQIQTRRQNRQTASRLQSARLAERSIAELTTMFAKMSTLISQQGEVLERIEDDVEAAGGDIDAGHEELVKVYGYTKGNRGLILKVFGVLIF